MRANEIPLTRGLVAIVDDEDYELVGAFKWSASGRPALAYAERHRLVNGKKTRMRMHRFLMDAGPGEEVDHINGDRLDNRRANLRLCSHAENMRNTRRPSSNTSGFKGVQRRGRGWSAVICQDGKHVRLGVFATAEEAAKAYDARARQIFGCFARTNMEAE